jgi:hypothetical protein
MGQSFASLVPTVAAAESAIGLAIFVLILPCFFPILLKQRVTRERLLSLRLLQGVPPNQILRLGFTKSVL